MAVLGAGRGLGVVLHGEHRPALDLQALERAVEERRVGLDHAGGQGLPVDDEAVVLAGDRHPAGFQVLDRMVGAPVPEVHLEGPGAQRQGQNLVAQADAEHGQAAGQQSVNHGHRVFPGRRRVAGAVGEEYAVRPVAQHVVRRGGRGDHGNPAAGGGEAAQDVALGAEIDGDHVVGGRRLAGVPVAEGPRRLVPGKRLAAGHLPGQVHALEPRPGGGPGAEGVDVDVAVLGVDDGALGGAAVANAARQPARIHPGDGDQSEGLEPGVQVAARAPVGRVRDGGAQHAAAHRRGGGFDVLGVGAHVADVGEGKGDDLAGIGRIGEDFLVPGDGGVEADLAHRRAHGPGAAPPEHRSVVQHQRGVGSVRTGAPRCRHGGGGWIGHGRRILRLQVGAPRRPVRDRRSPRRRRRASRERAAADLSARPNRRCLKQKPGRRQGPSRANYSSISIG